VSRNLIGHIFLAWILLSLVVAWTWSRSFGRLHSPQVKAQDEALDGMIEILREAHESQQQETTQEAAVRS
jgi:hypothetical protein